MRIMFGLASYTSGRMRTCLTLLSLGFEGLRRPKVDQLVDPTNQLKPTKF